MNTLQNPRIDVPETEDRQERDFPTEVFPTTAARFIREPAASTVVPPEMVGVPLLVAFASGIGASRVIRLKEDWQEGATIYAAVIAPPSSKKTPAANKVMRYVKEEQNRLETQYEHEMKEYERVNRVNDENARPSEKPLTNAERVNRVDRVNDFHAEPTMQRTWVSDTTVEALGMVLKANPKGLLSYRDELSGWIRSMDQYKGGKGSDRQFWLDVWTSTDSIIDRVGRQKTLNLKRPYVSVYGGIQPAVLKEISAGRDDGLFERFIFTYPEPMQSYWSDEEVSDQSKHTIERIYDCLRELELNEDGSPKPVDFDSDAHEVFKQLVNKNRHEMYEVGFPQRLVSPWTKLESYLARLTLVLSLVRSAHDGTPERIELGDVVKAHALVEYFKGQARKVYGFQYGTEKVDQLAIDVMGLVRALGGCVREKPSFIFHVLRSEHKPERVNELTKYLEELSKRIPELVFERGKTNGDRWIYLKIVDPVDPVDPLPIGKGNPSGSAENGVDPVDPVTYKDVCKVSEITHMPGMGANGDAPRGKEETIELGARLLLYALGRQTDDWRCHTEAVKLMQRRFTDEDTETPF